MSPSITILFHPLPFVFIHYFATCPFSNHFLIFTYKEHHQKCAAFCFSGSSFIQGYLKSICSKFHCISIWFTFIINQIWWKYPHFEHVEHTGYYDSISWGIPIRNFLSDVFGILLGIVSLSFIHSCIWYSEV